MVKNVLKLFLRPWLISTRLKLNPDNGGIHLGRGFSKFYLGDKTGACEDWMLGSAHGVSNAAELSTEYCKG